MGTFLLAVIYIAFIGLGLPDSLFGAAWPAIYADFSLPISWGSFVTVTVALGTIISSLCSARLIAWLGTAKITAISTFLTAAALFGFSLSPNIWCMVLLSLPLGIGGGAIDVALNNYVSLHYSARQMSFLHCFYGVGVSVSPSILSIVMKGADGWRRGYTVAAVIQVGITAAVLLSLPLWKRISAPENAAAPEKTAKILTLRQSLSIPGVPYMCALFFITCALEWAASSWGSTYLVEYKHLTVDRAAGVILLYFIGMALGRFLSGLISTRLESWSIIYIGMGLLCVAMILLLLPGPVFLSTVALFLIGLGNGPMFPNYNYMTPKHFGEDVSQSVIGVQMSSAYVGIMLGPVFCGLIGQNLGMHVFPYYLIFFYALMIAVTVGFRRKMRGLAGRSCADNSKSGTRSGE